MVTKDTWKRKVRPFFIHIIHKFSFRALWKFCLIMLRTLDRPGANTVSPRILFVRKLGFPDMESSLDIDPDARSSPTQEQQVCSFVFLLSCPFFFFFFFSAFFIFSRSGVQYNHSHGSALQWTLNHFFLGELPVLASYREGITAWGGSHDTQLRMKRKEDRLGKDTRKTTRKPRQVWMGYSVIYLLTPTLTFQFLAGSSLFDSTYTYEFPHH